jgi:serine/threonine protein kinase
MIESLTQSNCCPPPLTAPATVTAPAPVPSAPVATSRTKSAPAAVSSAAGRGVRNLSSVAKKPMITKTTTTTSTATRKLKNQSPPLKKELMPQRLTAAAVAEGEASNWIERTYQNILSHHSEHELRYRLSSSEGEMEISSVVKELIAALLDPRPERRMTIRELMTHPWLCPCDR